MKLLLHMCCGPCATYPAGSLRNAGHEVWGFFYNPNIHPLAEHQLRLESLKRLLEHTGIPATIPKEYGIEEYFRRVAYREGERLYTPKLPGRKERQALALPIVFEVDIVFDRFDVVRESLSGDGLGHVSEGKPRLIGRELCEIGIEVHAQDW